MKNWSDENLLDSTCALVDEERRISLEIIRHLTEIQRRRLYAKRGYESFWEFLTKQLKYSEPAAQERLYVMRLLKAAPSLETKIANGKLSLTTAALLSRVSSTLKVSPLDLAPKVFGKSTREAKQILLSMLPGRKYREALRDLPGGLSELRIVISQTEKEELQRLRDLKSHSLWSYGELVTKLVSAELKKLDPMTRPSPRAPEVKNPYSSTIPKPLRTHIWQRDGGNCTYHDPISHRRCEATANLEIDHITPRALGGTNAPENLRLLCREHNLLAAEAVFGKAAMDEFRT